MSDTLQIDTLNYLLQCVGDDVYSNWEVRKKRKNSCWVTQNDRAVTNEALKRLTLKHQVDAVRKSLTSHSSDLLHGYSKELKAPFHKSIYRGKTKLENTVTKLCDQIDNLIRERNRTEAAAAVEAAALEAAVEAAAAAAKAAAKAAVTQAVAPVLLPLSPLPPLPMSSPIGDMGFTYQEVYTDLSQQQQPHNSSHINDEEWKRLLNEQSRVQDLLRQEQEQSRQRQEDLRLLNEQVCVQDLLRQEQEQSRQRQAKLQWDIERLHEKLDAVLLDID